MFYIQIVDDVYDEPQIVSLETTPSDEVVWVELSPVPFTTEPPTLDVSAAALVSN